MGGLVYLSWLSLPQVEVKMRKTVGVQWAALEGTEEALHSPQSHSGTEDRVHQYPTSAPQPRDWDRLVAEVKNEEKEEKPEGDAALNTLFQQIYKDGSDEVKKAMNKSFVSSANYALALQYVECRLPAPLCVQRWSHASELSTVSIG